MNIPDRRLRLKDYCDTSAAVECQESLVSPVQKLTFSILDPLHVATLNLCQGVVA